MGLNWFLTSVPCCEMLTAWIQWYCSLNYLGGIWLEFSVSSLLQLGFSSSSVPTQSCKLRQLVTYIPLLLIIHPTVEDSFSCSWNICCITSTWKMGRLSVSWKYKLCSNHKATENLLCSIVNVEVEMYGWLSRRLSSIVLLLRMSLGSIPCCQFPLVVTKIWPIQLSCYEENTKYTAFTENTLENLLKMFLPVTNGSGWCLVL